jgi:hypothetical protein
MLWMRDYLFGIALFHNPTRAHHEHPVAKALNKR